MKISRIIGYLLIISGILLNTSRLVIRRNIEVTENNKVKYTLEKEVSYRTREDTYDAILSIPKISLKKGIYKINDERNNINENIVIHKSSIYPNQDNSNVILIAHSGSGDKAIFKDLGKLDSDTLIELYYKHTKYIYKIDHYYNIDKTGEAMINRDGTKKTITLITCNSKDKSKQDVYIGYLIDEVKY